MGIDQQFEDFWTGIPLGQTPIVSKLVGNRERILVVPVVELVNILAGHSFFRLPPCIPMDSTPLRTFQDDATHSICIVIGHPSFPPVELGYQIPRYNLVLEPVLGGSRGQIDGIDVEGKESGDFESGEREI